MKFRLEVHLVPEYIRNLAPVSRYHGNWLTVRGSLSCGRIGPPASLWKFGMTSEERDGDREKEVHKRVHHGEHHEERWNEKRIGRISSRG